MRCEAILTTCNASKHGSNTRYRRGAQCPDVATDTANGRCVCWVHKQASGNPVRVRPLAFVEAEPEAVFA